MHRKFLIIMIFMSFFDCFARLDTRSDENADQMYRERISGGLNREITAMLDVSTQDQVLFNEPNLLALNQQLHQDLLVLGSIDDARITGHRRFREQTNLNEDEQIERLHQSRRRHGINLDPNLDPNRRVISRVGSYDQFQASLASQTIIQENN